MEPLFQVIIERVARHYALTPGHVLSRSREKSAATARMTAMYVARVATEFSFPEIGKAFKRDHTTVMAACTRCASRTVKDDVFRAEVDQMVAEVVGSGISELTGGPVKIRKELIVLLQERVRLGVYARSVEELVDRILCDYFQRESALK